MARKIRAKLIMELRDQGMSRRSIAKTRHMSMGSVCEVFDIADDRGITWDQVKGMGDERVYELFYPDRNARESVFEEPDWSYVHAEMAKVGVNLHLLHDEYKSKCSREHMVAMGYTRFCERYGDYTVANNLTKRIEHKAGVSCEVDWSGPTVGRGAGEPGHRGGLEDLPVRRRAPVQPEGLLRADAGHEGAHLAALPRAHVRVLGRRATVFS